MVSDAPATVAASLLESYAGTDVRVESETVRSPEAFAQAIAGTLGAAGILPVVALHTSERATLRVAEGTHVSDADGGRAASFTDYPIGGDQLLILDARARIELQMAENCPLDVIRAVPALF